MVDKEVIVKNRNDLIEQLRDIVQKRGIIIGELHQRIHGLYFTIDEYVKLFKAKEKLVDDYKEFMEIMIKKIDELQKFKQEDERENERWTDKSWQ